MTGGGTGPLAIARWQAKIVRGRKYFEELSSCHFRIARISG